jgi:hypothetical protein
VTRLTDATGPLPMAYPGSGGPRKKATHEDKLDSEVGGGGACTHIDLVRAAEAGMPAALKADASGAREGELASHVMPSAATQPAYHRLESPTQTSAHARAQAASGEIWGRAARGSGIPCVKAYRNALPAHRRGIEFVTPVAPTRGSGTPYEARWYVGTPGVRQNSAGFAVISATVTRNTQVP